MKLAIIAYLIFGILSMAVFRNLDSAFGCKPATSTEVLVSVAFWPVVFIFGPFVEPQKIRNACEGK